MPSLIKETAHFLEVAKWFLLKNDRNAFLPRLESSWHQPISKPIGVLNGPCTFEGVNGESMCFERVSILFSRTWCASQVLSKKPMLSRYTSTISSPHRTCSRIFEQNQGRILGSWGSTYIYIPKGVVIMQSSWDSPFSSNE